MQNILDPIFITGIYRSGTTLVSRILNNHPELSITYDSVHFMRFSYGHYDPIHEKAQYLALIEEIRERIQKRWDMTFNYEEVVHQLEGMVTVRYADVYHSIMSALLLSGEARRWGEKTNVCWRKIPEFLQMFPQGKAILVVRDPRDVLCSFKYFTEEKGLRYLDAIFASLDAFNKAIDFTERFGSQFYCLKFENLIQNPEKEIRAVCSFLDITYDQKMNDQAGFLDKQNNPWRGNSSFEKSLSGISAQPVGRYKHKLDAVECHLAEMVLENQMKLFSYKPENHSLSKVQRDKLQEILNDKFIAARYKQWLNTGQGVGSYPSDPIQWANRKMEKAEPIT